MTNILIIGGNRNMERHLAKKLLTQDHHVTLLDRGATPADLPSSVHYLHVDTKNSQQLKRALLAKSFDIVVDFAISDEQEALNRIDIFQDQVQHYVLMSSGQVYLIREGITRPYTESDYEGRLLPAPKDNTYAYEEWSYGMRKRNAEDAFINAFQTKQFPITILRLPMVNSLHDPFNRLYHYYLRIKDGGGILVPETPTYRLRHVYASDVVKLIHSVIETGNGKGRSYNVAQSETVTIDEFLALMAKIMDTSVNVVRFKNSLLDANGFLPDCSPYSDRWMSEMDSTRSQEELGFTYTSLEAYLTELVQYFDEHRPPKPIGYKRRAAEIHLIKQQDDATK